MIEASSYSSVRGVAKDKETYSYRAKRASNLEQSTRMASVRSLALQNGSSGVDPTEGCCCSKINLLGFEPPYSRVHDDTGARHVSQPQSGVPPRVDLPAELNFVLVFVKTSTILHLERMLRKQDLGIGDASSEHNEAFLIVFLRRRVSANGSDVGLQPLEVLHDLPNTHCANVVDCTTDCWSAIPPIG